MTTELTEERADEIMKERGYIRTATSDSRFGKKIFYQKPKVLGDAAIHAEVKLWDQTVTLAFKEFAFMVNLVTSSFNLEHKDFSKFEASISTYAAKCLDIDLESIFKSFNIGNVVPPTSKPPKVSVKERKDKFWEKIREQAKKKGYEREMCMDFFRHWTEMNEGGRKMRFEMKDVFNIAGRLVTWHTNEKKFDKTGKKNFYEKKIETQNEQLKKKEVVNVKTLF